MSLHGVYDVSIIIIIKKEILPIFENPVNEMGVYACFVSWLTCLLLTCAYIDQVGG